MKHGDDFHFEKVLPAESQKEVIREWLKQAKNSKTRGSEAFHETMFKHNPKNIREFMDKLYKIVASTEYMRKEVARFGGGEASSRSEYRDSGSYRDRLLSSSGSHRDRERSRSRERDSRADRKRSASPAYHRRDETPRPTTEHISAVGARHHSPYAPVPCTGCGKRGHGFAECPFIKNKHLDANKDSATPFCQSTNGRRWIQITGRTQLTNAFDSVSFKRPGSSHTGSRHTANDAQGARPPSPAGHRLLSALEARRSESPQRGRRGGHASRSRTPSRSRSRERARRRHGCEYTPAHHIVHTHIVDIPLMRAQHVVTMTLYVLYVMRINMSR